MDLSGHHKKTTVYHNGDGFYYRVSKTYSKYRHIKYVKCINRNCGGRGKIRVKQSRVNKCTVIMVLAHNHGPSFDFNWKQYKKAITGNVRKVYGMEGESNVPSRHRVEVPCSVRSEPSKSPTPPVQTNTEETQISRGVRVPETKLRGQRHNTESAKALEVETKEVNPQRRRRIHFTAPQLDALKSLFSKDHYPNPFLREDVAKKINLTVTNVNYWFKNQRAYYLKLQSQQQQNGKANLQTSRSYSAKSPSPSTLPTVPQPPIFDNNLSNNASAASPPNNDDMATREASLHIPTYYHHQSMMTNTTQLTALNLSKKPTTTSSECSREPSPMISTSSPSMPNFSLASYRSVPLWPTFNFWGHMSDLNATSQNYCQNHGLMGTAYFVPPLQPVSQLHPMFIQKEPFSNVPSHSMTANTMQLTAQAVNVSNGLAMPQGECRSKLSPTNMMPSPPISNNSLPGYQIEQLEQTMNFFGQMGVLYSSLNQMHMARYLPLLDGRLGLGQPPG